ncbi:MAG TPA: hypothetical protein VD999_00945 [Vitreimonas sp.]|nr:hypothetical protein [Vitreimonas sp.]
MTERIIFIDRIPDGGAPVITNAAELAYLLEELAEDATASATQPLPRFIGEGIGAPEFKVKAPNEK